MQKQACEIKSNFWNLSKAGLIVFCSQESTDQKVEM